MEINQEKIKILVTVMFNNLKLLESELLAYKTVVKAVALSTDTTHELDQAVEDARNSAALKQIMTGKYDAPLAQFLERLDQAVSIQEGLLQFLQSWKSEGPIN
jgi:hypothetical protein